LTPDDRSQLKGLLANQRLASIGVLVDGRPVVGLFPYALETAFSALYVQASRLAKHAGGLVSGAPWSGVIHAPDRPDQDPLQVPRLVLEGVVEPLAASPELGRASEAYRARFEGAAMTLSLGDFALYRLEIRAGRLILGFGRALNLSSQHFEELARS
jgi:hypothetical protein